MRTDAIKLELIEWLARMEDKSILASLLQFKKATEAGDWVDNLSPEQLASLDRGMEDIKKGRTITNREFWAGYGREV